MALPGGTLAGYLFRIADPNNANAVQVLNADVTKLFRLLLAICGERFEEILCHDDRDAQETV